MDILIQITKIKELKDAEVPNNIPINWSNTFYNSSQYYKPPEIGKRFYPGANKIGLCNYFSTSPVVSINLNKITTCNSVYEIKILKNRK